MMKLFWDEGWKFIARKGGKTKGRCEHTKAGTENM